MIKIFDAHCDTGSFLDNERGLYENDLHLDISRMMKFEKYIQVFASFADEKRLKCKPMQWCINILNELRAEIQKNSQYITLIDSVDTLKEVNNGQKAGGILSIEGGGSLEGEISALKMFYDMGVRLITLTWNNANEIADGILESRGGGLTDFGKEAVKAMEDMGIVIDVSHLSEQGFWDVAACTAYPFTASHSCVKNLCGHVRNLSDEQISLMIDRRCVIGINFYPKFLTDNKICTVKNIIDHMEYILSIGGEDCLGLGSDFDGVDVLPENINGVQDVMIIAETLVSNGFSAKQTNKILFENFYRLFYETLSRTKGK